MSGLPKGYRTIQTKCPCGRTVPFVTWDGAKHLPMMVRCACRRVMTHGEALDQEEAARRDPPSTGSATPTSPTTNSNEEGA